MIWHIFKTRIKRIFGDKTAIFWTLLFPLILATFFKMALSNVGEIDNFEITNIAVVTIEENKGFQQLITVLSTEGSKQIFNTQNKSESEAKKLLEEHKISGYYLIIGEDIQLILNSTGMPQTVMKTIVDEFYRVSSSTKNIAEYDYKKINQEIINNLYSQKNYFNDKLNKTIDPVVTYFYALIGMVCLMGGTFGVDAINDSEANLSKIGARMNMSPVKKRKIIFVSALAALSVLFFESLITLAYIVFILNIDFVNQIPLIILTTFIGCSAGIMLGMAVGAISKKNAETKYGILILITMTMSFFAGMMFDKMKYLVNTHIPWIAKFNPISQISDALYSLYYFDTLNKYIESMIYLVLFVVVMSLITVLATRRKKYDSI